MVNRALLRVVALLGVAFGTASETPTWCCSGILVQHRQGFDGLPALVKSVARSTLTTQRALLQEATNTRQ